MHSTNKIDDGYLGSGVHLTRSIKKYGKENHERQIIEFCDSRASLEIQEKQIVNEQLVTDPNCMNIVIGGKGGGQLGEKNSFFGRHHTKETIAKIRTSMTGSNGPCFGRCGKAHPMFGTQHSHEARIKMSLAHKGKHLTTKHRDAIMRGHAKRRQAGYRQKALIISKIVNEGFSYKEVAKHLNVGINAVYGAVSWYRQGRIDADVLKEFNVVSGKL